MNKNQNNSLLSPILQGMRIVELIDATPSRQTIFDDIASRKRLVRWVYNAYRFGRKTQLAPLLVSLYGIKSFLAIGSCNLDDASIVSVALYPNEQRAIEELAFYLKQQRIAPLVLSNRYIAWASSWIALAKLAKQTFALWRIAAHLAKKYDFMPACRIYSTLAYYLRTKQILAQSSARAMLVASMNNPAATGARAAAMATGRRVIYTNHAHMPLRAEGIPKLCADLAVLTGDAIVDSFKQAGPIEASITYKGVSGHGRPLQLATLQENHMRIGIFLTMSEYPERLRELILRLSTRFAPIQLRIRPHPNPLTGVPPVILALAKTMSLIFVSKGLPLSADIASCDLVICGNSGVALEVLCAGVPVLYCRGLDANTEDYNGFVTNRLIPAFFDVKDIDLEEIRQFYSHGWEERMRYYDAGYGIEGKTLYSKINQAVCQLIGANK